MECKRPAGAYPLRDFHKICIICTMFQDALAVKISLDFLKALWSYGGYGLVIPKFSAPPSGETVRQSPKCFGCARTCSRSSITVPSLVRLAFNPPPRRPKTSSFCLSVCRHAFKGRRFCVRFRHEGIRVQTTETILMPLDRGRFVVGYPCSTQLSQIAANCRHH